MASDSIAIPKWALALVVGLAIGFFVGNSIDSGSSGTIQLQQAQAPTENQAGSQRIEVSTDDDPFLGDENAPVTIIEFSDFECPFCGRAYGDAVAGIKENYIESGDVKLVYRDLPLSFHPQANPAALAANCANEQGKFWEYHDTIFENQQALSESSLKQWAGDLGLDTAQFNSCFDSAKYQDEIDGDLADARTAGASGTPTFFVGNDDDGYIRIVGAQPYSVFQQAIENELN